MVCVIEMNHIYIDRMPDFVLVIMSRCPRLYVNTNLIAPLLIRIPYLRTISGCDIRTFEFPLHYGITHSSHSIASETRWLTHWGRSTHIWVIKLTIVGSDNGLTAGRRQAIIWTNAGIFLIWPLGTNFSEILIGIQTFSFRKCTWRCHLRNGVHFVSASMC